jgi:S-DNA-T family DNA segregation ATPase FtsK/SpoIIIE
MLKQNENKVETIVKTNGELSSRSPAKSRLNGIQRLRESVLIIAILIAIFFSVSLLTYSPADPSWSQTAWGTELNNAGGYIGAWVADTLFFIFGSLAYAIPVILISTTWLVFIRRIDESNLDLTLWATRLLGITILLLTSCGLADINFDDLWYFSSGGVVGDVLSSLAIPTFNILGSTLIFLFFWGAGFTLFSGISWLTIVEFIGDAVIDSAQFIVNKLRGEANQQVIQAKTTIPDDLVYEAPTDAHHTSSFSLNDDGETQPDEAKHQSVNLKDDRQATPATPPIKPTQRRFNIHLPQSHLVDDEHDSPEQIDLDDEETDITLDSLRVQRLDATIEELDDVALQYGDFAQQDDEENSALDREAEKSLSNAHFSAADDDDDDSDQQRFIANVEVDDDEDAPIITNFFVADDEMDDEQEQDLDDDDDDDDPDVTAFQNIVAEAQKQSLASQNPFLVQKDINLPKPKEPLPTLDLLYHPEKRAAFIDQDALEHIARLVESKLADYKIVAEVVGIFPGPVITRFELDLAAGVKVSRISSLSMDLARSLSAPAVRVVEVIPGKPYVGIELPNLTRETVFLSDVINSEQFKASRSPTTIVLGQDIAGEAVVADLAKMPHVLVAGTTGSGKSVGVNVMILSMLYKSTPDDVRFIMIDPKMLELSIYEGIPHLLSEVVTDMKDAANALRWCVAEMERRYKLMSVLGVRNIKGFNDKLKMAAEAGHPIHDPLWQDGDSMEEMPPLLEKLPYIVVIIDEFADLMMVVGKKVEELIARLAQKARAAGIHLILATQRPSVDVITGLIKANIPTRVAFTVSTKTDSRTILDQGGAETLLGMGDMLYLPPGSSHTVRVHGAFASDDDVHAVVNNWKARGKPNYISEITHGDQGPESLLPGEKLESDEEVDPLFDQVVEHVVETRRGSVSGVQRRFKIGYNRAARIVEQLEAQGIVSAPGHNGNREVLAPSPSRD